MVKARKELVLEGLDCANCAFKIETKVKGLKGMHSVSMNFATKVLALEIEDADNMDEILIQTREIVKRLEPDVNVNERTIAKAAKKEYIMDGLG